MRRRFLLREVQQLLEEAEESLGRRIELQEDSRLSVAGTTAVVRGRPNYGIIRYSPNYADCTDYVVANQCCRIVRYGRAPPECRVAPVERPGAYQEIRGQVEQHAGGTELAALPAQAREEIARLFLNGLIAQVTSIPADCRIDRWLYANVPRLRAGERRALATMLESYGQSRRAAVRRITPPAVFGASNAMNGAFARNAARMFPELQEYDVCYRSESAATIDQLASAFDCRDEGYQTDVRTADAWARELGLGSLFEWKHEDEIVCRRVG